MNWSVPCCLLVLMTVDNGCEGTDPAQEGAAATAAAAQLPPADLPPGPMDPAIAPSQPGDHGPQVKAVYDHLMRFGYFPNAALAQLHPLWRPAVAAPPADPQHFSADLKDAVLAYQRNFGLPQTGKADKPTLQAMMLPRCGVPDNIPHGERPWPDALYQRLVRHGPEGLQFPVKVDGTHLPQRPRFNSTTHREPYNAITDHAAQMAGNWNEQMARRYIWPVELQHSASAFAIARPDIILRWHLQEDMGCGGFGNNGVLAHTHGQEVHFNDLYDWWIDDAPGLAGTVDFKSIALHQFGHTMGLGHVSESSAAMYPAWNVRSKRVLQAADRNAAHGLHGEP